MSPAASASLYYWLAHRRSTSGLLFFLMPKHLEQTESQLSWCFWWIGLCRWQGGGGDLAGAAGLNPTGAAAKACRWNRCKSPRVCCQGSCVWVNWTKSEGRPHTQMLLCVVCCWFPLLLSSSFPWKGFGVSQWSSLGLLQHGKINAEEEEKSVWYFNQLPRLSNS